MRRAIDTAPRDGEFVILEDDASGSFELARWSAEARAWVRENGELSKITPTHWHTTRRDEHLLQEGDESLQQISNEFLLQREQISDEFLLQRESGSSGPSASREPRFFPFPSGRATPQRPAAADDVIALRQVAKADPVTVARLEARAALDKSEHGPPARRRFAVSSIAAAMVAASLIGLYFRAELATYVKRSAGEHDTAGIGTVGAPVAGQEALANELARAQQVIETQVALASKTRDNAAQLKQAAKNATAELRLSLQKEHDRAEALASELAKAQRDIETQAALASKTGDEAAQLKQAAESAKAALSGKKSDEAARPNQAAESATAKPSAAEAKQCSAALPSNPQGRWSYRLIDGRKCWYQGEKNFPKSLLQWSEQDFSPHGFQEGRAEPRTGAIAP